MSLYEFQCCVRGWNDANTSPQPGSNAMTETELKDLKVRLGFAGK